ncbi:IL6RA protein, partial [Hemiprocne comata]|nr:IL6RA protein [Hemiprocne comata]
PPGLSRDVVLGRPGGNITLICQDKEPANVTVSWRLEERGAAAGGSRWLAEGGNTLLLRGLRYEDSGRYSCSVGGRPLRSLRLLVEGGSALGRGLPPQCHPVRRPPHDKDILCEWPLRAKPSPGTRAMLWV